MYARIGTTRAAYFDLRAANGPRGPGKLARNCAGVFLLLPTSIPRAFILYCNLPNRHSSKLDEKPARRQLLAISSEALIGIGITVAALGLLGLLLGWAQQMREVSSWATVWLALGAVLAIVGLLIVAVGGARRRRS